MGKRRRSKEPVKEKSTARDNGIATYDGECLLAIAKKYFDMGETIRVPRDRRACSANLAARKIVPSRKALELKNGGFRVEGLSANGAENQRAE
ncbi:hypothetical protein KM043_006291 [Ampulex compressa]|nr:hypothetical protein KM043_006291 [Ampulex compressa]